MDLFKRICEQVKTGNKKSTVTDYLYRGLNTKSGPVMKKYSVDKAIDTIVLSLKTLDLALLMPQLAYLEANQRYKLYCLKNIIASGGASIIGLLMCVGYSLSEIYDSIMTQSFIELLEFDELNKIERADITKYKGQTDAKQLTEWINMLMHQRFKFISQQRKLQSKSSTSTVDLSKLSSKDLAKLKKEKEKEEKEKKEEKKEKKYTDDHKYTFKELYELTGRNLIITGFSFEDPRTVKDNVLITSSAVDNTEHGGNHIIFFSPKTTPDVYVSDAILGSCAIPGIIQPANINKVEVFTPFLTYDYPIDCLFGENDNLFYIKPKQVEGIRVYERKPIRNLTGKYIDECERDALHYKMYVLLQHMTGTYILTKQQDALTTTIFVDTLTRADALFPYFVKTKEEEAEMKMKHLVEGFNAMCQNYGSQNIPDVLATQRKK